MYMCMVLRTITATPFQLLPFIKSLIIDGRINSVNIDTKKGMLLEIGRKTSFENLTIAFIILPII